MIRIQNNAPRIITLGSRDHEERLKLLPGINELETDDQFLAWEKAKATAPVQHHLEEGVLVEMNNALLGELPAKDAIKFVEGCVSREQLNKWKKGETRDVVVAAIEKQIKKVTPAEATK